MCVVIDLGTVQFGKFQSKIIVDTVYVVLDLTVSSVVMVITFMYNTVTA